MLHAPSSPPQSRSSSPSRQTTSGLGLGNFGGLWDFLGHPSNQSNGQNQPVLTYKVNDRTVAELDAAHLGKAVKWRDEVDGADLEDNNEPIPIPSASLRTLKRAERRARARARNNSSTAVASAIGAASDTATDPESADELESIRRRSPDRRAIIANILGRPRNEPKDDSPPTSPSPPTTKVQLRTPKREWPVSDPFTFQKPSSTPTHSQKQVIVPRDGLTPSTRKLGLIKKLSQAFPEERRFLSSSGLPEPAFTPLNTSPRGIHVFVDISNISIGLHDCLKEARGMSQHSRIRRVPLDFHNLSLVFERGRPAAKRVLAGSDKTPAISQAMSLGYEANMLERVHKTKELTASQKKRQTRQNAQGYHSASGPGETSGSETNGYLNSGPAKWVEQAVDEILHLKMLESLVDSAKDPSTIVLATGDAAEAEYSGGFMQQVERALANGWVVELVSFTRNTSSLYTRHSFRQKWGTNFKFVQLDQYAEYLINEDVQSY